MQHNGSDEDNQATTTRGTMKEASEEQLWRILQNLVRKRMETDVPHPSVDGQLQLHRGFTANFRPFAHIEHLTKKGLAVLGNDTNNVTVDVTLQFGRSIMSPDNFREPGASFAACCTFSGLTPEWVSLPSSLPVFMRTS
jgi:hypothetical protein